jgi:4-diphosphocytidyl-2-C-methyl-D-erythritol kinase
VRIRSFAKVNLGIEVLKKRDDGYHEIRTLFQTINFFDILEFIPSSSGNILLHGDDRSIPWNEDNLIYKAAASLKEMGSISQGIEIRAAKKIPSGKGLGGGSSNAAMTLYALNKIWALNLQKAELMDLGRNLGADVPYFLEGGLCLGTGAGDVISPLEDLPSLFCLLGLPALSIPTSDIYKQVRLFLTSRDKDSKIIRFLNSRDFRLLENKLEEPVFRLYPQIKETKSLFQRLGPELSLVSGTGAAVFGLFSDRERAEEGLKELKLELPTLLVETLPRLDYWDRVNAGV